MMGNLDSAEIMPDSAVAAVIYGVFDCVSEQLLAQLAQRGAGGGEDDEQEGSLYLHVGAMWNLSTVAGWLLGYPVCKL